LIKVYGIVEVLIVNQSKTKHVAEWNVKSGYEIQQSNWIGFGNARMVICKQWGNIVSSIIRHALEPQRIEDL
jgi:hypothetical protein